MGWINRIGTTSRHIKFEKKNKNKNEMNCVSNSFLGGFLLKRCYRLFHKKTQLNAHILKKCLKKFNLVQIIVKFELASHIIERKKKFKSPRSLNFPYTELFSNLSCILYIQSECNWKSKIFEIPCPWERNNQIHLCIQTNKNIDLIGESKKVNSQK